MGAIGQLAMILASIALLKFGHSCYPRPVEGVMTAAGWYASRLKGAESPPSPRGPWCPYCGATLEARGSGRKPRAYFCDRDGGIKPEQAVGGRS